MPEGPSIVILRQELEPFTGLKVLDISAPPAVPVQELLHQKVTAFKSWGKHLLICFTKGTIRIHLLLFGSYRINEDRNIQPRLRLEFKSGYVNFYTSSVLFLTQPVNELYDWSADVMNEQWDAKAARKKLKSIPDTQIADALLDQQIFSGVGNIIKNEVLFRLRIHPESRTGNLPSAKITALLKEAVIYSFEFLDWKKQGTLKKHWQAHTKKTCPRCHIPFVRKYTGKTKRRSFFCTNCQVLY